MAKSLIISENANVAALLERGKAIEFFFQGHGFSVGDIYAARVENILPSINAVFVNLGSEKMGFLHANDIPGNCALSDRIWPKQKLLVQITKEPTGNKGPRVSTDITLMGRFFVLTTEHQNIVLSRRITSNTERARLKSIAILLKPAVGFGLIIRTEAVGANEKELEEDFRELFLEKWKYIIDRFESQRRPALMLSDSSDLLYKVLRDVFHEGVDEVIVDSVESRDRSQFYLNKWGSYKIPTVQLKKTSKLLKESGFLDELHLALSPKLELPSGGYLYIQPTEALTVIDVNSGKFTSSKTPEETVLLTNLEAATETARQLRLRNVGGVIVIDFIDMDNKADRLTVLEHFEKLLENDPARPQIGRLSDLGLVELTRHRQEQTLYEALGEKCQHCHGIGLVFPIFNQYNTEEELDPAEGSAEDINYLQENQENSVVANKSPDKSNNILVENSEYNNDQPPYSNLNRGNINSSQEKHRRNQDGKNNDNRERRNSRLGNRDHKEKGYHQQRRNSQYRNQDIVPVSSIESALVDFQPNFQGEIDSVKSPIITVETNTKELLPGVYSFETENV